MLLKKLIVRDTFNFASSRPLQLIKILKLIKNNFDSKSIFIEEKKITLRILSIFQLKK